MKVSDYQSVDDLPMSNAVWGLGGVVSGECNTVLGMGSAFDLTTQSWCMILGRDIEIGPEDYQFALRIDQGERTSVACTIMTPEEAEVIRRVVLRAIAPFQVAQ